ADLRDDRGVGQRRDVLANGDLLETGGLEPADHAQARGQQDREPVREGVHRLLERADVLTRELGRTQEVVRRRGAGVGDQTAGRAGLAGDATGAERGGWHAAQIGRADGYLRS